jgi:hypothetical protein
MGQEVPAMDKRIVSLAAAIALAAAPLASHALGTNEKGCLVGGAAGGLVGHTVSGNNTLLGAAIGCGAGVLINKERVKKKDAEAEKKKQQQVAARRKREERRSYAYQQERR